MKKHELIKFAYDNYPKGVIIACNNITQLMCSGTFYLREDNVLDSADQCIYDGERWATIINDKQLVLVSEDGINLYVGDNFFWAKKNNNKWLLTNHEDYGDAYVFTFEQDSYLRASVVSMPDENKAFSIKEASEKWIEEQNKQKVIEIKLFEGKTANVQHDLIRIFNGSNTMNIKPSDLEDLIHAYKSLQ